MFKANLDDQAAQALVKSFGLLEPKDEVLNKISISEAIPSLLEYYINDFSTKKNLSKNTKIFILSHLGEWLQLIKLDKNGKEIIRQITINDTDSEIRKLASSILANSL